MKAINTKLQLSNRWKELGLVRGKALEAAWKKHLARALSRQPMPVPRKLSERFKRVAIPLGKILAAMATDQAKANYPRKSRWSVELPAMTSMSLGNIQTKNKGRYSTRCSYTKFNYHPLATSYGVVLLAGSNLFVNINQVRSRLAAPPGYLWDTDVYGIRLLKLANGDDFHPDSDDIAEGVSRIRRKPLDNAVRRRSAEVAAKLSVEKLLAKLPTGCMVGILDSAAAGNCATGTASFATRHGLDSKCFYRPAELIAMEPANARVRLAIVSAARRHRAVARAGAEIFYPRPAQMERSAKH